MIFSHSPNHAYSVHRRLAVQHMDSRRSMDSDEDICVDDQPMCKMARLNGELEIFITHTYTHIHTLSHTYTHIHIHTHTYTHTNIHTHARTHSHIQTLTHT